ncbi:hypothetical protein [Actinomadura terrae]|uniref:hypothetical protein n=1 Tax=Actinomadura terrae TaxID=604353 RepID=UPI001FA6B581|nr:hypothetical protein [Actinomadura terrae]
MSRENSQPERRRTLEILDTMCRELAPAANELNEQQLREARSAPSFVFVAHSLHRTDWLADDIFATGIPIDTATRRPLHQFQ